MLKSALVSWLPSMGNGFPINRAVTSLGHWYPDGEIAFSKMSRCGIMAEQRGMMQHEMWVSLFVKNVPAGL